MAGKKLEYDVEVDASGAVADLKKLGDAGEKAGKQIGDGFKDVGSKSEAAFDKVIGNLKLVTDESKRTIEVVGRIGDKFGEGFDPAATAKLVNSLRQAGVEFDTIEARADELATTMREIDSIRIEGPGAGLRAVGTGLDTVRTSARGVGDELDHVRNASDQSRSVLANMAGNSAQDLGQLGGVVGSLGVGIGQLAEYAVDGNIALSNLAKVAGPLGAVAVAGFLIQDAFKNAAETKAFNVEQAQEYADAIGEVGDSMQAVVDIAQDGLEGRVRDESILGGLLDKEETIDLIAVLDSFGLTLADVNDAIRSGATDRTSFVAWMHSGTAEADAFIAKFPNLAASGTQYTQVLEGLAGQAAIYTTAADEVAQKNRVMASSLETVNEQLRVMQIDDDPLSVVAEGFVELNGRVFDLGAIWRTVVGDLRDGQADYAGTAHYVDILAEALHLTVPEVLELAKAQGDAVKSADDFQQAQSDVEDAQAGIAESTQATTDALNAQADAYQAALDKQQAMVDAAQGYADAQQAFRDATADLPRLIEETNAVMADSEASIEDRTAAMRTQRDETISWLDGMVQTRQEFEAQNGTIRTAAETQADYAEGLALIADTVSDEVIPAVADYYSDLLKIPEERQTEFEMVLARGDEKEIEAFIAENSGTTAMSIEMELEQEKLNEVKAQIGSATQPKTVPVTAVAHTVVAKGVIAAAFSPVSVPVNANTNPAKQTMDNFRRNQANTPIYVKVAATTTGGFTKAAPAASAGTLGAAPLALTPFEGDESVGINPLAGDVTVASFGTPVSGATSFAPTVHNHVTIQAAVIGSRFDVQRAVTKALRAAQRINGGRAA